MKTSITLKKSISILLACLVLISCSVFTACDDKESTENTKSASDKDNKDDEDSDKNSDKDEDETTTKRERTTTKEEEPEEETTTEEEVTTQREREQSSSNASTKDKLEGVDTFITIMEDKDPSRVLDLFPEAIIEMLLLSTGMTEDEFIENLLSQEMPENLDIFIDYEVLDDVPYTQEQIEESNAWLAAFSLLTPEELEESGLNFDIDSLYATDGATITLDLNVTIIQDGEEESSTQEITFTTVEIDDTWTFDMFNQGTNFMTVFAETFGEEFAIFS
ncbi:MAG: hypothetical protein LBM93_00980 [Oscillospiraceae bacterium]|jgi:hypothetical protein|nr:hypothetical protein [Oscillospiraceae bacterium]